MSSANERIVKIKVEDIQVGDLIFALNPDPEFNESRSGRQIASAVRDDMVRLNGVWFSPEDGWKFKKVITPETVEVKEPNAEDWTSHFTNALGGGQGFVAIRSVEEASKMITLEELRHRGIQEMWFFIDKFRGAISWEPFAFAVKRMGMDNFNFVIRKGWELAKTQADDSIIDAIKSAIPAFDSESFRAHFKKKDAAYLMILATAYGKQGDSEFGKVIDKIGLDNYMSLVQSGVSVEDVMRIGQSSIENGVDAQILASMIDG